MNGIFLRIINMSISASWLVLAVLALRLLLKKAPKWVRVLLWGIVAVRLVCPFSIESPLSLVPSAQTVPMNIEMDASPAIDSGIDVLNSVVNPVISASFTPHPAASANPLQIWIPIASILWIAGMVVMLLYTAVSYWQLRSKVRTAVLYRENIFQSEHVGSPFVLGIVRPKIYLPFKMDDKDLELVIAHEQAHIRRKDHWWKPLGFLLLAIHWFNPLVWLGYVLLCRDIELACDEKVIKELDNAQKADYTQALLVCSIGRKRIAACPLAFGEVGVKERVRSVMNYKKPAFWFVILAVVVCVAAAVCFLTNPQDGNFDIMIDVPAGHKDTFLFSSQEISPLKGNITLQADADVTVKLSQITGEDTYEEMVPLSAGVPFKLPVKRGVWYKVGILPKNSSAVAVTVRLNVDHVQVRITEEVTPDYFTFEAEILEIQDGYFLVEPVPGSTELKCADRIEIPMQKMDPSQEPQVGDIIVIQYNGMMQETYPARPGEIYSIKVRQEEVWALIPMVMVDGQLYLTTGYESQKEERVDAFDGEITSQVDGSERPTENGQSNFGKGYGYQYGTTEGTIEIYMDGKWWIYATEEAREKIQFPTSSETGRGNETYRYFLTVGAEGVVRFEVSTSSASGGFQKANGAAYKKGDRVWLESLDGCKDLRGLEITAFDKDGEVIWTASVPDTEENVGFTHLKQDDWEITDGL